MPELNGKARVGYRCVVAPRSPLPPIRGLDAARLLTPTRVGDSVPQWETMGQWLRERLPVMVPVDQMIDGGEFVYEDGAPVRHADPFRHQTFIWFHRETLPEPVVPGDIHVVYQDQRILVVDKPPFLATTPRGRHVRQSVVVRLRDELGRPELAPMHRLDRNTSGLLALTVEKHWRGVYQPLFDRGEVARKYWALAPLRADLRFPRTVSNHLKKTTGVLQAAVVPGETPNAETLVELEEERNGVGLYRLTPLTGRTHQLRAHLCGLGIPILNDPLYPEVVDIAPDDFTKPMQLLAGEISFVDPVTSTHRFFRSERDLPLRPAR